jgi:hypothetical protein
MTCPSPRVLCHSDIFMLIQTPLTWLVLLNSEVVPEQLICIILINFECSPRNYVVADNSTPDVIPAGLSPPAC